MTTVNNLKTDLRTAKMRKRKAYQSLLSGLSLREAIRFREATSETYAKAEELHIARSQVGDAKSALRQARKKR